MYRGQEPKEEEIPEQDFSLRVTFRNMKTGLVEKTNPYILRMVGDGGNKQQLWERPAGSGNLFNAKNEPIGRWDKSKPEGERFLKGKEHIEWKAPETSDQRLAREYAEKDSKINQLERELAAIKVEREGGQKSALKAPPKKDQGA